MSTLEVTIPKAVSDASDESDAALDRADGVGQDTSQETPPETQTEQAQTETPPAQDSGNEEQQVTDEYLQKYRTIQGKYNAEVPRLQAQLHEMQRQLQDAERRREQPPAKPVEPKVDGQKRYLKKEELDEYGDSLLDLQSRMARGVAEDVTETKISELRQEMARMQSMLARTSGESFWDKVEQAVPGARSMNESDQDWHAFLGTADPVTGQRYRDLGINAIQSGDSSRLIAIFRIFAATLGPVEEVGSQVQEQPRATPPVKPNGTRTVSQAPKQTPAKGTIRESEITKFYNDVTRGIWKGREKEQAEREKEIEQATDEGRITPG